MTFAPLILTIVVALALGTARGGRITSIADTRLHSLPLLVAALIIGFGVDRVELPASEALAIGGLVVLNSVHADAVERARERRG